MIHDLPCVFLCILNVPCYNLDWCTALVGGTAAFISLYEVVQWNIEHVFTILSVFNVLSKSNLKCTNCLNNLHSGFLIHNDHDHDLHT